MLTIAKPAHYSEQSYQSLIAPLESHPQPESTLASLPEIRQLWAPSSPPVLSRITLHLIIHILRTRLIWCHVARGKCALQVRCSILNVVAHIGVIGLQANGDEAGKHENEAAAEEDGVGDYESEIVDLSVGEA